MTEKSAQVSSSRMWAWVHLRSEQSALEHSARLCGRHSRLSSDHHGPSVSGHEVDAPDGAGTHEEHRAEVLPEHGRVHRCRWHCKDRPVSSPDYDDIKMKIAKRGRYGS